MSILIIIIAALVAIIALLIYCFRYVKKKIRNKIIDITADIITETTGKYVNEKNANKINTATNIAAQTLKKGNANAVKAAIPPILKSGESGFRQEAHPFSSSP